MNILEYLASVNTDGSNTGRTGRGNGANITKEDKVSSMRGIYRFLISKDPAILTTEGAFSIFQLDDENLNEEIIRILQANKSPVLFELYRRIMGTEATHRAFFGNRIGKSYITGKRMTLQCHHQEWYNFRSLIINKTFISYLDCCKLKTDTRRSCTFRCFA